MNESSFGPFLVMVFSWCLFLSLLIILSFFKIFLHIGTFRYVMRKKDLTTMRKVIAKCLNLIFYSFIGTCYPNFEQRHSLLLFHEFFTIKRKATLVDFVDDNFFSFIVRLRFTTQPIP